MLKAIKQKINSAALDLENNEHNEQIKFEQNTGLEVWNDNVEVDVQELAGLEEEDAYDEEQQIISATPFTVINDIIKQEFQTNESIDEFEYEDIEYLDNNTLPDGNSSRPSQYVVMEENVDTSEQEYYYESVSDANTIIDENDVEIYNIDNQENVKNVKVIINIIENSLIKHFYYRFQQIIIPQIKLNLI